MSPWLKFETSYLSNADELTVEISQGSSFFSELEDPTVGFTTIFSDSDLLGLQQEVAVYRWVYGAHG